jgi:hypothetical protein
MKSDALLSNPKKVRNLLLSETSRRSPGRVVITAPSLQLITLNRRAIQNFDASFVGRLFNEQARPLLIATEIRL